MTHVFIVDETTFKYHLEYMFAGTGAQDKTCPFLIITNTNIIHSTTERNLVGMIADVSRIRVGDKVIFYLQARADHQGMFFGVFEAVSSAFFDENDYNNYLVNQLGKGLSFRVIIKPYAVYPLGITEHEYLDSLKNKTYPYQMCWSLIYRKLKGNRGCTMITDYEYDDLLSKLIDKNGGRTIQADSMTFDIKSDKIVTDENTHYYTGKQNNLDITPRMLYKASRNNAFEVHLQAYILQNYDLWPIKEFLLPLPQLSCWIGNEVSCGVGMQRIDIMIKQEDENTIYLKIIELKCTEPYNDIVTSQIPWYIEWACDYVVPNYFAFNKTIQIIPCIIAKQTDNQSFLSCMRRARYKSTANNIVIKPIEYIGFTISETGINFCKI